MPNIHNLTVVYDSTSSSTGSFPIDLNCGTPEVNKMITSGIYDMDFTPPKKADISLIIIPDGFSILTGSVKTLETLLFLEIVSCEHFRLLCPGRPHVLHTIINIAHDVFRSDLCR